ncbi:hypothetical protein BSKO_06340 [Bryopsis sp. KO-2023]|nr:hypothetical protein BSKO_06340 [Bryopsis sp. KO-2023]
MGVIPQPLSTEPTSGRFLLPREFSVACFGPGAQGVGQTFSATLASRYDLRCTLDATATSASSCAVTLRVEESATSLEDLPNNDEAFELTVSEAGITIVALQPNGLFYGTQTLFQLIPPGRLEEASDVFIDGVKIIDAPRFKWRGTLLDVGRHFYSTTFVRRFLDILALHKINRFHWHLVEDQGWRLEIKSLAKLTEIGAWRCKDGEQPYGGYYRQEEIPEIIAYAKERFIEVVPEIELPGHCGAALASYPHLSCTEEVLETPTDWGVHEDVYCAGKEEVFKFLEIVMSEVCDLFPFEYFHIGGDECPKLRWRSCEKCQSRIKEQGLSGESELQSWFISRASKFLKSRGKKIIGWDEILEGGIPDEATVMSWRGMLGGLIAAKIGHDVIMSPTNHCYLDYRQSVSNDEAGAWYAVLPLHQVYAFDPIPSPPTQSAQSSPCQDEVMEEASSREGHENPDEEVVEKQKESSSGERDLESNNGGNGGGSECKIKESEGELMAVDENSKGNHSKEALRPLTVEEEKRILGGQANLWTEYVEDEETCEYMLLPRLCAFAEAVWSPKGSKDWNGFSERLEVHLKHFDAMGVKYRPLS